VNLDAEVLFLFCQPRQFEQSSASQRNCHPRG